MKKNKTMRLASVLLILTLLTTSVISGTFAKYTTAKTVGSSATVAEWSFKVADKDITEENFTVDLFATVSDLDDDGKIVAGDDANVEDTKKIIAPGTGGSFNLTVENTSEVKAKYTITLSEITTNNVPLEFSVDGATWVKAAEVTDANISVTGELEIGAAATTSGSIYWRWQFSTGVDGDVADTELGINGASPSVTVKVVAEQVD